MGTERPTAPADIAPMFDIDEAVLQRAQVIKLAIFDVDGVLTNGTLFMGDDGQEYKAFNSRDGHGMKMLVANGVETAIITGRQSEVVKHRARDINIKYLHQGAQDKLPVYEQLIAELGLTPEQTAFVGDDIVDLPIMLKTGLSVAVADAHPMVKEHSHWVTPSAGGCGAAREFCEMVMFAQGNYAIEMRRYL
ncbi:MAG: 3-deoxy-manno-octulosonate-8-phosphatase KdsC [Acidiferrobacterales bacterium]|jgi:3-deoxy-D-manno-octulosonate 8-phosphate phosphatase (KDO 8-P phosphatase)|nr:3-deoxy-manno-octulosonate-8-phosphatase KdsC [Acidiferrobacterales bacterium]